MDRRYFVTGIIEMDGEQYQIEDWFLTRALAEEWGEQCALEQYDILFCPKGVLTGE